MTEVEGKERAPGSLSKKDARPAERAPADHARRTQAPTFLDPELRSMLGTFLRKLLKELGPNLQLVILYGSHASTQARADSDVDLFVVLRDASERVCEKVREAAYGVMWQASFAYVLWLFLTDEHHFQTLQEEDSLFVRAVQQEGKVLWPVT